MLLRFARSLVGPAGGALPAAPAGPAAPSAPAAPAALIGKAAIGVVLVIGLGAGTPAVAGTLYHWRTEDGSYAYTDDLRRVPARYRDQVERRTSRPLSGYEHYTPQEETAGSDYARALRERVEHLRAFNAGESEALGEAGGVSTAAAAASAAKRQAPSAAAGRVPATASPVASERVEVRLSNEGEPVVRVPAQGVSEPVVIEKIVMLPEGSNATRTNTVVRQGDRVIAIVKPRDRNTSVFYPSEEEFESGQ